MGEELDNQNTNNNTSNFDGVAQEKARKSYVVYYDVYDHGFVNGVLKTPKEPFEQFIFDTEKRNLSRKELGITLQEIEDQKTKIAQTWRRRLDLENTISSNKWELQANLEIKERVEADIEQKKSEIVQVKENLEHIKIEYNYLSVILFMLMGLIFISSDFYITYDVLYNGLKMFVAGAIALALAMSGITFVIKPTIDRLFEKPYLNGERKKKHILLLSVSALAIIVLGLLGYYREEYLRSELLTSIYKSQMNEKEDQIRGVSKKIESNNERGVTDKVKEYNIQKEKLLNEKLYLTNEMQKLEYSQGDGAVLYAIFIISNILFALSAAICLSIAFPALDRLRNKTKINRVLKQLEQNLVNLNHEILGLIQQTKTALINKEQAANEIKLLPDLSELERILDQLNVAARALLQKVSDHDIGADTAFYNEAYERGKIYELSDRIIIAPHEIGSLRGRPSYSKNDNSGFSNGSENQKTNKDNQNSSSNSGYLHQQIRQVIEYNHQKNKNLLNGEDD